MAIKVLASGLEMNDIDAKRFQREAQVTARISHPHIVAVTDCGKTSGRQYFVMEYLVGADLGMVLQGCAGPLDPAWVVMIGLQVCRALQAVHDAGVLHRDVKPENIFLTKGPGNEPDFVKLVDFGIARVEDPEMRLTRLTRSDSTVGTVAYMSPEQARAAKDLDGRSDLYSLAAVLYELLTGVLPIPGQGIAEVLSKKQTDEPNPITFTRTDVPFALDSVILRALSRNRDDRPASMAEFARLLEEAMQGTSTDLPVVDAQIAEHDGPEQVRALLRSSALVKSSRRVGLVWVAAAAAVVLLLALVAALVFSGDRGDASVEEAAPAQTPTAVEFQAGQPEAPSGIRPAASSRPDAAAPTATKRPKRKTKPRLLTTPPRPAGMSGPPL